MMPRSPIHQTMRGCALACCALWMIGGRHWSRTASGAQDAAQPAPNPDPAREVRVEPLAPDALRDPTELPPRLVTSDGRTYENARVMRIEKGGIMVRHATGLSLLRFGELPAEIAARFQPLTPPKPRLGSPLPRARAPTVAAPRGPENGSPDGRAAGGKGGPWYDWRAGTGPVPAFLLGLGAVTALAGLAGLLRHAGRLCGAAEATYMRALTIVLLATVLAAALAILHAGVVLGEEAFVLKSFAESWREMATPGVVAGLLAVLLTMYLFQTDFVTALVTVGVTLVSAALVGGGVWLVGSILTQVAG